MVAFLVLNTPRETIDSLLPAGRREMSMLKALESGNRMRSYFSPVHMKRDSEEHKSCISTSIGLSCGEGYS